MSGRGIRSRDQASDAVTSLEDFLRECDAALIAYLQASDDDAAARELKRLHEEFIRPAARAELTRLVRRGLSRDRKELQQRTRQFPSLSVEVEGDAVLHLASVRAVVQAIDARGALAPLPPMLPPIRSVERYVAGMAMRAHATWLRRHKPGRYRLEQRIRYALRHTPGWCLWRHRVEWELHDWLCGQDDWRQAGIPRHFLPAPLALPPDLAQEGEVRAVLRFLFDTAGGPVLLDDILDVLADAWDVEATFRTLPLAEESLGTRASEPGWSDNGLQALLDYWHQLEQLSPEQRAAFLLRAYQPGEDALLFLFVDRRVVTLEEAANAVRISWNTLQVLRDGPPLNDETIGELMGGKTAAQVRSYRQEARRRLRRVA